MIKTGTAVFTGCACSCTCLSQSGSCGYASQISTWVRDVIGFWHAQRKMHLSAPSSACEGNPQCYHMVQVLAHVSVEIKHTISSAMHSRVPYIRISTRFVHFGCAQRQFWRLGTSESKDECTCCNCLQQYRQSWIKCFKSRNCRRESICCRDWRLGMSFN